MREATLRQRILTLAQRKGIIGIGDILPISRSRPFAERVLASLVQEGRLQPLPGGFAPILRRRT